MSQESEMADIAMGIVAPAIGAIFANLLWLGPLKEILEVRATKDLGNMNPYVFPVMVSNCIGWTSFGFVIKDPFIVFANISGIYWGIFYSINAFRFTSSKVVAKKMEILLFLHMGYWGIVDCLALFALDESTAASLTSYSALAMAMLMFLSTCLTLKDIILTKDSSSINRGFMSMQIINCAAWVIYGLVLVDFSILIGNGLGLVIGLGQIVLITRYPRKQSRIQSESSQNKRRVKRSSTSSSDTSKIENNVEVVVS